MANQSSKPATTPAAPVATRNAGKRPVAQKEKQKAIAFFNWRVADDQDETLLRSTKGFPMFDNEFLTLEEKALIQLAKDNGGSAIINAELRIVIAQDKPESLDTSKIKLVVKK